MAEFINTIEALGDDVVIDSIIDGTITEFKDNTLTVLRGGAFGYCRSLVEVIVPNVETISVAAFESCNALKKIDCSATSIGADAFRRGTTQLKAVILRNTEVVATLASTNAFLQINNSNGYFYVPRALLSDDDETKDYRRATNWSNWPSRFRALEDYTVDGTVDGDLDETKI